MEKFGYDRNSAVEYAHKWAYFRNPEYYNYAKIGGDCTNFASQCIWAGTGVMNFDKTQGWYYRNANDKAPAWTGVEFLRNFLVRSAESRGPVAIETDAASVLPGDIAQISFDGKRFSHTLVIVDTGGKKDADGILIAAHDMDCDYRVIGTYEYKRLRFLHITHVIK